MLQIIGPAGSARSRKSYLVGQYEIETKHMTVLTFVQPDGYFSNMLKGCIQNILVSTKMDLSSYFYVLSFSLTST